MARALHTLSTFGFAASAGVSPFAVHPLPAALCVSVALLLTCAALQAIRDLDVASAARAADRGLP